MPLREGVRCCWEEQHSLHTRGTDMSILQKVHTILCRWSYLPLLFVVTPANCNDGPLAIPMFAAVLLLYHLCIRAVWADVAYFHT